MDACLLVNIRKPRGLQLQDLRTCLSIYTDRWLSSVCFPVLSCYTVGEFYLFWVLFNFSSILSPPLSPSVCLYTLLVFMATESYQVYICPVFK